jgi:hypothetical protein
MVLFYISSIESFIALCSCFDPPAIGLVAFETLRHEKSFYLKRARRESQVTAQNGMPLHATPGEEINELPDEIDTSHWSL